MCSGIKTIERSPVYCKSPIPRHRHTAELSPKQQSDIEDIMVQAMADRIVDYARLVMHKKGRVSPFQLAASRAGLFHLGGVSNAVVHIHILHTDREVFLCRKQTSKFLSCTSDL